ncbi:MAG TPA: DinB family protein [Candidatus Limnocylindrales bacterium]
MIQAAPDPAAAVAALLPALREAAEWAGAMVRRLGEAATAPGPDGGWTPVRIVVHLAAVDAEVWSPRLRQLAAHEHPSWAWTEPDLDGRPEPSAGVAADAFCATRAALLETAAAMDEAALHATGVHATFGELDVVGVLGEVLRHDAEHLASLAEAVAARSSGVAGGAGAGHG